MKKIFLLFLLVCSTNLYAQHIVFKGVALGQHYSVLGRTLLNDGFELAFDGTNPLDNSKIRQNYWKGDYWEFKDVSISVDSNLGGTLLSVSMWGMTATPGQLSLLVSNLDKKYGTHTTTTKLKTSNHNALKYVWRTKNGNVEVTRWGDANKNGFWGLIIDYVDAPEVKNRANESARKNNDL